ncbi:MAG: hypothetical protein ACFFAT_02980 [Promethearchaeota archaeon]
MLTQIQNLSFLENFENFEMIPLEEFLIIFNNKVYNLRDLDKSLSLLEVLNNYITTTMYNSDTVDKHCNLIENIIALLKYIKLLNEKDLLEKELKIAQIKTKSSDIAAKTDLLNKLTKSLDQSKKQLTYLEEDYLKIKNQKNAVYNEIESLNLEILDLNNQKKEFFNQINKITRDMDEDISNDNNSEEKGIPKSEKIKNLQMNAKEVQFKIKQIKSKIQESQIKYNRINPKYEKIEKDYQEIVKILKNDEEKIKSLKKELEKNLKTEENDELINLDINNLTLIKSSNQIQNEIASINDELTGIEKSIQYLNNEDPKDLSIVATEIEKINENLKKNRRNIIISEKKEFISDIMQKFKLIEHLIKKIEGTINKFLIEINLESIINLYIKEDNKNLIINIQFLRSNKEKINFQDLTTPEKIYFILGFHISIQMQLNLKDIIFTNLFIHNKYNKRGSIFRTIRKLIPIFETEPNFKKYRLIFVLSNLELKDEIENLIIKNI